MRIKRFLETPVEFLPGITQEAVPQSAWPYLQDWIVSHIKWDAGNRCYWLEGRLLNGEPFFWGMDYHLRMIDGEPHIKLDRRYDLTNTTYGTGRHETEDEARRREDAARQLNTCPS